MFLQTLQGKLRPMKLRIIRCHGIVSATGDRHNHNLNKQTVTEPPSKSHLKPLQSHAHRVNDQSGANSPSRRRDSSFYVLITCMDKNSGGQSLRIPSRLISLDVSSHAPFDLIVEERIMLPGVSGFSTIILSVLQRGVSKDFLLGQCSLNLGNDHIWKRGGHFNLVLQEQEYAIKDHIGMDMKTDSRLIPCGSIEFDLIAFNGMTSECGYCYATNADDFVRTLARLPDYRGFIIPAFGKNALGNALSGNAGSSASNEVSASKAMGSSESYAISMKKIWIVIAEGMLFIYSHFGDQLKVAIEIAAFTHNFEYKDYGKILMYKLHKAGYPDFVFYTASANDSLRWKCAFLCSVRLFGQPATKPLTLSESFDMMPLLQDLWMLESLKPNSYLIKEAQQVVQMQGQVGSSTHHHNSTSSMHSSGGAPAGGGGPSIRSSFGSIAEVAKIFAANGGMRQSHLVKGVAAMGTTRASVLAPVVSPTSAASSSLLKKAQKQLADAGIVDKLPSAPTIVPFAAPSASSKAPSNQQQIFMAIGAQLISERIQEESALDDVVTDEKYQKHGETFVKYLLTAIAEKKQLLKKTKTSSKDLLEEYGLVPNSYR